MAASLAAVTAVTSAEETDPNAAAAAQGVSVAASASAVSEAATPALTVAQAIPAVDPSVAVGNIDQARHETELLMVEQKYLTDYIIKTATELLNGVAGEAFAMPPLQRLAELKRLLPIFATVDVPANVLAASPKIAYLFLKIRDVDVWQLVFAREISADPEYMKKKAEELNKEALADIRAYCIESLAGTNDQFGQPIPGEIAALENAILNAQHRFDNMRQNFMALPDLNQRLQLAISAFQQANNAHGDNQDEQDHLSILLEDFCNDLRSSIGAAQLQYAQVVAAVSAQTSITAQLAMLDNAIKTAAASQNLPRDGLLHYTQALAELIAKLQGAIDAAHARFAAQQEAFNRIDNIADRLQAVQQALQTIPALQIADPNELTHFTSLLTDLSTDLKASIDAANQRFYTMFDGLEGMEKLHAVKVAVRNIAGDGLNENAVAYLRTLLQRLCNKLESDLGQVVTDFKQFRTRFRGITARIAAVENRLAEIGRRASVSSVSGSAALLSLQAMQQQSAPRLADVVVAAVAANADTTPPVPVAAVAAAPQSS